MNFSEKELTPKEIEKAEREDTIAFRNGSLDFLMLKYRYIIHAEPPSRRSDYLIYSKNPGICCADGEYTPAPLKKNFIMLHGGYYAVIKECIARKIPWEELLNVEPYLTWLREEQSKGAKEHYKHVPAFDIYKYFPDYFNREELQAGFTCEQLEQFTETNLPPFEPIEMYLEPMKIFKKRKADLLKKYPDHYDELKKYYEEKQKEWKEQCLPRLKALEAARDAIYRAATKFFLENDELPPKPQKGAGEAWQKA